MIRQERLETKKSKYHFGGGSAKAIQYFGFTSQNYQNSHVSTIEICQKKKKREKIGIKSRYRNISDEKKNKKKKRRSNKNIINQERIIIANS